MSNQRVVPFLAILLSFTGAVVACSSSEEGAPSTVTADPDAAATEEDGGSTTDEDGSTPGTDGSSPGTDAGTKKDGAATDSATPKDSAVADTGPKPEVCVAGTQGSCSGAPLRWNVAKGMCCMDAPATCKTNVAQADCASVSFIGRYEYWTGAACCVQQEQVTCSPNGGSKTYCTVSGTHSWSPDCCMDGKYTCTSGTFSYCNNNNFSGSKTIYSGSECCVAGNWSCTAKGAAACPVGTQGQTATSCCNKI